MEYRVNAIGAAAIINGEKTELEKILENEYGRSGLCCSLDYDFFKDKSKEFIVISDSEKYCEEDTTEFLEIIAPYITEGGLNYASEDDRTWRFIFDPATKSWNKKGAKISHDMSGYSDEELIEELKKRGYVVK